jgi:hypothetical protein
VRVDVYEFCAFAGNVVTRGYRARDPRARDVDAAHGRIVRRTGLRATLRADDPDVLAIIAAAAALDTADQERHRAERERERVEHEHDLALERQRAEIVLPPRPGFCELVAAVERLDQRPSLGALRRLRGTR